jgi:hypothetical protein
MPNPSPNRLAKELNNPLEALTNIMYLVRHDPSVSPRILQYTDLGDAQLAKLIEVTRQLNSEWN